MAIKNEIRIQVKVKEFVRELGHDYCDALYYTQEQYYSLTQDDVDREVYRRIANWIEAIKNPPVQAEPTEEQLVAEKLALEEQIAQLTARKSEVSDSIMTLEAYKVDKGMIDGKIV